MIYIVKFVSQSFCVLINPLNGSILYQNSRFLKLYRPRGPIFDELSAELQIIMGSKFDPYNYKGNKALIKFIENMQKDKPVSKSSLSNTSVTESDLSLKTPLPVSVAPDTPANFNDELKDEFCSSISSIPPASLSTKSHISNHLSPPKHDKKLEKIIPSNSILRSLRNLPSRMARTFKK